MTEAQDSKSREGSVLNTAGASLQNPDRPKVILFNWERDQDIHRLASQVKHFGYSVRVHRGIESLTSVVDREDTNLSALVLETVFKGDLLVGADSIKRLKQQMGESLPVFFISDRDDIRSRLNVIRAGGDEFFLKPVNVIDLVERLDMLTSEKVEDPYRILIVDDEPKLAYYYSIVLKRAGMQTRIVNNPLEVFNDLFEFNPDLILMDMYMPECNGIELAKMIRQMKSFVCIPIVFLSAETDPDRKLSAMSVGGDDFISKPVQPEHLVSSVMIRAQRMRMLRSFMDRDSLTGLLNHTKTKEHLDISVDRARRLKFPVAFAMIDIDHFKSINDTYGHYTGDMVIVTLARLLQQRMRKTDIIGRYGGEEFAVVLNSTDAEQAGSILNEIRESFSQIKHHCGDREFSVTFSCGIASFPDFEDSTSVLKAADEALYSAKKGGKNRVVIKTQRGEEIWIP